MTTMYHTPAGTPAAIESIHPSSIAFLLTGLSGMGEGHHPDKHYNKQTWRTMCALKSLRLDKKCYFMAISEKHLDPGNSDLETSRH